MVLKQLKLLNFKNKCVFKQIPIKLWLKVKLIHVTLKNIKVHKLSLMQLPCTLNTLDSVIKLTNNIKNTFLITF